MPLYDYACVDCELDALKRLGRELTSDEYDEMVLFETSHSMSPSQDELLEATTCPRCNSVNCTRSYKRSNITGYVRGDGYLDRAGTRRDMNLYHLTQDDPYAEYRQPGEVDEMKAKIKRSGQHNPHTKYFDVSNSEMQGAVKKAIDNKSESN